MVGIGIKLKPILKIIQKQISAIVFARIALMNFMVMKNGI